jgi:hypothetical protein
MAAPYIRARFYFLDGHLEWHQVREDARVWILRERKDPSGWLSTAIAGAPLEALPHQRREFRFDRREIAYGPDFEGPLEVEAKPYMVRDYEREVAEWRARRFGGPVAVGSFEPPPVRYRLEYHYVLRWYQVS